MEECAELIVALQKHINRTPQPGTIDAILDEIADVEMMLAQMRLALNIDDNALRENHQVTPHDKAVIMLRESHVKVMTVIESLTDEELFEKKYYSWTGTTNIGSYCISVTASHYDWAMKKITQYLKQVN